MSEEILTCEEKKELPPFKVSMMLISTLKYFVA